MRKGFILTASILICFLLQTSVFEMVRMADTSPNVLLILVSSIALMRGQKDGMVTGFFCGLLLDIFFGKALGGYAFLYMLFGFVDGFFNRMYYQEDNVLPLVLFTGNDLVYGLLMYIHNGLLHGHLHIFYYLRKIILPEIVYTVAVGMLLYRILLRVDTLMGRDDMGSTDII